MILFRNICRILVGLVFVFSGFVKGVDPLGTTYRIEDYFLAFNMPWAVPLALTLSIFLCTLEFILGISLLFNLWLKHTSWILFPMMIFFTLLTLFDVIYNLVPDCGCFGDALKLTNLETFLKNVVLMALVIPVFISRKRFRSILSAPMQGSILGLFVLLFAGMAVYAYRHLPVIDFMEWKVGNQVNKASASHVKFYVTYKNKKTGEEMEYVSPDYPWNDSVWMSQWEFKSQRTEDPNQDNALSLRIEDKHGTDLTRSILDNPDYHFILAAYDLSKANKDAFLKILPLYKQAEADGISFICLTSSLAEEIERFRLQTGTVFEYYNADDVILKTMIRSNPGLILLKEGRVLAKWHYHDFPSYEEIRTKFMEKK